MSQELYRTRSLNPKTIISISLLVVRYLVRVKTGALWDAGTTCKVDIFLTGEFGDSGPRSLWQPISHNEEAFQQDQVGIPNKSKHRKV